MKNNGNDETRTGQDEMEQMTQFLRNAVPHIQDEAPPERDLWPAMVQRMHEEERRGAAHVPWWDWALASGLVAFAAVVPRTIPVILYYL